MEYSNQQQSPPPSQIATTATPFKHLLQHHHHHHHQLQMLWEYQRSEIENVTNDFKNHQLPLARIKKIMKADEDVRMISAEAPVLFSKACELFILELTIRSWLHAEDNKRRTLQRNDIAAAITTTDILDFLVDLVPKDHDIKEEGFITTKPHAGREAAGVPYYYPPVGQPSGEVTYGQPAMDPSAYGHQPWQPMWHQQGVDDGDYSVDGQGNYIGHHHHHPN